ncbi:MAG: hypothetical protein HKO63_02660 [Acidimicrobiia bacterium]|nr:hypothetical protein [Acidimicrobiia bacterium]RZV46849.1 MAG: hypothetical protein EX267_02550 [Acidimicrobiia bacterium]
MLDREQRALLVVPYAPPPAPRRHLYAAIVFLFLGSFAVLGLAMAEYSAATTASLVVAGTVAFLSAVAMLLLGVRARRRHRLEMERAVEPIAVQPVNEASRKIEAS